MTPQPRILSIALPTPVRRNFDYGLCGDAPLNLIGFRVEVSFGNQTLVGVVIEEKSDTDVPDEKFKLINTLLDEQAILSHTTLDFLKWAARYYHHSLGEVIHAALPKNLRLGKPFSLFEQKLVLTLSSEGLGLPETALSRSKKQQAIFQYLLKHKNVPKTQLSGLGFSASALKSLKDKHIVCEEQQSMEPPMGANRGADQIYKSPPLSLNDEQQAAVSAIKLNEFNCALLDGVTGSGKTEVYMHLVAKTLAANKQALILIPEIGLCPQTITRFSQRFDVPIAQLHSAVSEKKRGEYWQQAKNQEAGIIIGTRLAALCECANLGIIIVDEEHDLSYKQHDGFRYSARDIAVYRAHQLSIPIVLGSATPSLETFNNALTGRYLHLKLENRAGIAAMPELIIDDAREQTLHAGLTQKTLARIQHTIAKNKQAIIFLNRRGFAPSFYCNYCGWMATCVGCEMPMTYHNHPRHLHCHRCDKQNGLPRHCPNCQNQAFSAKGVGTEQIENFLKAQFADVPVLRIDRDTTTSKKAMQEILDEAQHAQACLLVGTQMLAKGHHLPKVNLVVVVDADQGLMSPDFRGIEHVGQLITQVAGRAGRGSSTGEVIIQTLQPEHPMLVKLVTEGYQPFAHSVLQSRKNAALPPFGYCALIRAEAKRPENALALLNLISRYVNGNKKQCNVQTIGPLAAPIEKLGHRFRFQYQLFSSSRKKLHMLLTNVLAQVENTGEARRARWSVDIDPITSA